MHNRHMRFSYRMVAHGMREYRRWIGVISSNNTGANSHAAANYADTNTGTHPGSCKYRWQFTTGWPGSHNQSTAGTYAGLRLLGNRV